MKLADLILYQENMLLQNLYAKCYAGILVLKWYTWFPFFVNFTLLVLGLLSVVIHGGAARIF